MIWTKEDTEKLKSYRNIIDSDNIKIKEKIKRELIRNRALIHVLNNKELEENEAEPDDYFGINILPFYILHKTIVDVENYVCFETSFTETVRGNDRLKNMQIIFYILCNQKTLVDSETGIARHDLIAAIITDQFNWTDKFGARINLVSDRATVVDFDYACRTLTFEQVVDNNLVKTRNGVPRMRDKDIFR